ncbi:MAG TPA: hypothetical protein VGL66_07415 [Caulobacteraceae bacterium]|jgi:hypothetical protein
MRSPLAVVSVFLLASISGFARPPASVSLVVARFVAQTRYEPPPPSQTRADGSILIALHGVYEYKFRPKRALIGRLPGHDVLIRHAGAALRPIDHFILTRNGERYGEDVSWLERGLCASDDWVAENGLAAQVAALQSEYPCHLG